MSQFKNREKKNSFLLCLLAYVDPTNWMRPTYTGEGSPYSVY